MSIQQADVWSGVRAAEASGSLPLMKEAYEDVLKKVPDLPAAWLKLGQLCLLGGTYRNALDATQEAANAMRRASRWQALPHVGRQLLRFDERRLIRELIEGADWDNPLVLSESAVLAQQLWLVGDDILALALLEHSMARLPRHQFLHFTKAEVLTHLGRLGEAEAEHELAIELAPDFSRSHRALAYLGPAADPALRITRMEQALRNTEESGSREDQIDLHYALFKELDRIDRVDRAWQHLVAGSELRGAMQKHDQALESRGVLALIDWDLTAPRPNAINPIDGPATNVFVVGMPRSGTTVLDRMLSNHPSMVSAGELNAFSRSLSWAIDRFYEPPLNEAVVDAASAMDGAVVARRYGKMTSHLRHDGIALVDKNPVNISNAAFIARSMPHARMVCMVRDPMDACFSNFKEPFAAGSFSYSNSLGDLATHYADFRKLVDHFQAWHPDSFMAVAYEDLVTAPREQLERIMGLCGIAYEAGQEDLTRNKAPVSTASKTQVRSPLNRNGIGAWRRYAQHLEPLRRGLEIHGFA